MKKTYSFINISLLLEEFFCFLTLGVGMYGIIRTALLTFSVILCAASLVVALVLFIFQYHRVLISENGVTVYYFMTTLFAKPEDIPTVRANNLWGVALPLSVYYSLELGVISGKRHSFTDGEILKTTRTKLALLSIGLSIEDKRDKTLNTPCNATSELTRTEHKLRDKVIRSLGTKSLSFVYKARGVILKSRPHTSYTYGYIQENSFIPLLEVNKRGAKYSYHDVSKFD